MSSQDSAGTPPEEDKSASTCPICAFIEAGPCKLEHQEWVKCRETATKAKKDYVEECQDVFKAFLQCTLKHEYYEPFHELLSLGGDKEEEPTAAPS